MSILITGAAGMIGSAAVVRLLQKGYQVVGVDRSPARVQMEGYTHKCIDLGDIQALEDIYKDHDIERVIHLAALAHTAGEEDLSYDRYHHINVVCARNVFSTAQKNNCKVLFISTVDVLGFTKGIVTSDTIPHPVSVYGKTKYMAEQELQKLYVQENSFDIFRFSPVYTAEIKRDIQKRYYLKAPNWAYIIGKGTEYEVLDIDRAVEQMADWCDRIPSNGIRIIKDANRLQTVQCIKAEKANGRAKYVVHIPQGMLQLGYKIAVAVFGQNKYTYLLNKAVYPVRSE